MIDSILKLILEGIDFIKKKPKNDWFSWRNNYEKKKTDRLNRSRTLTLEQLSKKTDQKVP